MSSIRDLKTIGIVGMGYVGLTLAVVLAKKGYRTWGIEINESVVRALRQGEPHFKENGLPSLLRQQLREKTLEIASHFPPFPMDAYIISVGTPLIKGKKEPDIAYIQNSIRDVAEHMKAYPSCNPLVMLRSTVPVGLSREIVIPMLERISGRSVGEGFSFVFAPERTIEGKAIIELEHNPQIVGGFDDLSISLATHLFRTVTPTIVAVSSIEAAEMIKIMDNSYRDVRFAYANEIALLSEKLGLDAVELIDAANTHYPRNNIPSPSPGVGGACLSKDPHILRYFSQRHGYDARLIAEARNINERISSHIVDRIENVLSEFGKHLSSSKIFVAGFAFKGEPETSDLRDSTTLWFLDELKKHASTIHGYDPVVEPEKLRELGVIPCSIEDGMRDADAAIFMNNHRSYINLDVFSLLLSMHRPSVFFDAWRMFPKQLIADCEGIKYLGVGL